jgi:hypothetical protein
MSAVNEVFIQHTAVGYSQLFMEGVDAVLPATLKRAEAADRALEKGRGIAWRSATNVAHILASGAGAVEATHFLGNTMHYDAKSIAVSGLVGVLNLGVLKSIHRHKKHDTSTQHEIITLTTDSITTPETVQDVMDERHHAHPNYSARNIENLEMCAKSNIVEAVPALAGPLLQIGWENGSATTVLVSNLVVMGMAGRQLVKDMRSLT